MVCENCGFQLENGQNVCSACGWKNEKQGGNGLKIAVSVLSALLLAAVVVIVVMMNTKSNDKKESSRPKKESTTVTVPTETTDVTEGVQADTTETTDEEVSSEAGSLVIPAANYSVEDEVLTERLDKVVAKMGNYELTVAQLQLHYWFQVLQYYQTYQEYIYYGYVALDITSPLDQQQCTENPNMTWQQYFLTKAFNAWRGYATMCMLADEAGVELPDGTMESMKESFLVDAEAAGFETAEEYVEAMLASNVGTTLTAEDYWVYMEMQNRSTYYFGQWYEDHTPTEEELVAYYEEHRAELEEQGVTGNVVDVRHILVMVENDDWATAEQKANDILKMWQEGAATEEFFAELANEYSEDGGSNTTGGLYSGVTAGQMVEVFNDWIMDDAREYGDTAVLKADYHYQGYHIMFFVNGEPYWKSVVQEEIMGDRSAAMVQEGKDLWPIEYIYDEIALGTPTFE